MRLNLDGGFNVRDALLASVIVVLLCSASFVHGELLFNSYTTGRWHNGVITIYADRQDGVITYLGTCLHEWGHQLYRRELSEDDLSVWKALYEVQGMESGYPYNDSNTAAPPEEEEFAECCEVMIMNLAGVYVGRDDCSPEKYEFIARVWK